MAFFAFFQGVFEKWVAKRGFLVVNLGYGNEMGHIASAVRSLLEYLNSHTFSFIEGGPLRSQFLVVVTSSIIVWHTSV
jgi:hypothetical protein